MKGVIYALLAMVSYSSTPTFTQVGYKGGIQTNTLLFSRHVVSLICLFPTIFKKGTFESIGKKQIPGLLILCAFSVIGNISFNYAYHYLPNMVAVAITLSYVVFVFVLEILLGRERFSPMRGLIIGLTGIGILIIAIPGFSGAFSMTAFFVGLFSAFQYSTQVVLMNSRALKEVPTNVILLTGIIPIIIYSFIRCVLQHEALLPSGGTQWFAIICLGTIGVIAARGLFYKSMRIIGATKASMIDTLEPFSSAILGFVFLRQSISIYTVTGSLLLMLSVVLLLREKSDKTEASDNKDLQIKKK